MAADIRPAVVAARILPVIAKYTHIVVTVEVVETITGTADIVAALEAAADFADIGPEDVVKTAEVVDVVAALESPAHIDRIGPDDVVKIEKVADVVAVLEAAVDVADIVPRYVVANEEVADVIAALEAADIAQIGPGYIESIAESAAEAELRSNC